MVNKSAKVYYVEPNWTNADIDTTNQSSPSTSVSLRQQALEDFCIYVNLEVEKKGRMVTAAGGQEGTVYVLRWTNSDKEGDRVSFLQGTKIKTENSGEVNSLTTNYTTYLTDIKDGSDTVEMFGIESIDINYDKYMVPNVTINFVDVRGAALFSIEERTHQGSHNNIGGFLSDDIASSFFNCFFTFPYPRFYLTVKGFYGQPVAYELTCTNFDTSFDSNTGNFNVRVTMAGYYFSFFNDVSFNALVAAPYSDAGGKQYWESRVAMMDDDFYLVGSNGERKPMVTLGSLLTSLANIQEKIKEQTEGDAAHTRQGELEDKSAELSSVWDARSAYINTLEKELAEKYDKYKFKVIDGGRYVSVVVGKWCKTNSDTIDDIKILELPESAKSYDAYKQLVANSNLAVELKEYKDSFTKSDLYRWSAENINQSSNKGQYIVERSIYELPDDNHSLHGKMSEFSAYDASLPKDNFFNYSKPKPVVDTNGNNVKDAQGNFYYEFIAKYRGFVQDLGNGLRENLEEAANNIENEIANNAADVARSEGEALTTIIGFEPTAYNITKILMAHFECLVKLYYDLAIKIYDTKQDRTPEKLGIGQVKTDANISGFIPPFPKLSATKPLRSPIQSDTNMNGTGGEATTINNGNGQTLIEEDEWVGNLSHNFLEEDFINGLLNGAYEVGQLIRKNELEEGSTSNINDNGESDRVCAVAMPVCPMDLVLPSNPWGVISLQSEGNDYDDAAFVGKCFYRMTTVLGMSNPYEKDIPASTIGTLDAMNFAKHFASPSKKFAEKLSSMDFDNYFKGIVNGTDTEYAKNGTWPWTPQTGSNMALNRSADPMGPNLPKHHGSSTIVPVCGVSYQQIKSDLKVNSDGSCTEPERLDNYVNTNQVDTEVVNDNVFTIDIRYGDYSRMSKQTSLTTTEENASIDAIKKTAFAGCEFSFDEYKSYYNEGRLGKMIKNYDFKSMDSIKSLKLKFLSGSLYDPEKRLFIINPERGNIFGSKELLRLKDSQTHERGTAFLSSFLLLFDIEKIVIELASDRPYFKIMPKIISLIIGSVVWSMRKKSNTFKGWKPYSVEKIPRAIREKCYQEFTKFCHKELDSIMAQYSAGFITSSILTIDKEIDDDDIQKVADMSVFSKNYKIQDIPYRQEIESFDLEFNDDCDTSPLVDLLFQPAMYANTVRRPSPNMPINDTFSASAGKAYWDAFVTQLKTQYEKVLKQTDGGSTLTSARDAEAPEDVKIAMYNYCKTFFDKWIAGGSMTDDFEKRWKLSNYFKPNDNKNGRFHFIDGFYNDMSDTILFDPTILVEDIKSSASQNNLSLMTAMSDLLSKNRFNLMCIQNFISLDTSDNMADIFKPIPYYQMNMPDEYPHFVATYTYEPSKHLDIDGAEYEDDGFMINGDSSMWPMAITTKNLAVDYMIPAFGVAYGMQYQSYFKDVTINMENPQNTEQSLKVQYELAGASTETVKARSFVTWGQDLFSLYSNTSYSASVNMLGCAWIQPMMYFCLTNIPMFRGTYLITKVSHTIRPGDMTTNFTGIRMSNVGSRLAKDWVAKSYVATGREGYGAYGQGAYDPGVNASIDNDCKYTVYPLYESSGNYNTGLDASGEENAKNGLSVRDNALVAAIRKTIANSRQLNGTIEVTARKTKKGEPVIDIKSSDKLTLASVFDMCLNGYGQYVEVLVWTGKQADGDPEIISIATQDSVMNTTITYGVMGADVGYTGLNNNFYKALYKKFGDVGTSKENFGRLTKYCLPFAGCTNQQEAANLLSGSGVQPCIQPTSNTSGSGGAVGGQAVFKGLVSQQKHVDMSVVLDPNVYNYIWVGKLSTGKKCKASGNNGYSNNDGPGGRHKLVKGQYFGSCTSGPQGWYDKGFQAKGSKVSLGGHWWLDASGRHVVANGNVAVDTDIGSCGFRLIAKYNTKEEANASPEKQPGDIMTIYTGTKGHCHAVMWTGVDWRSDCIERNGPVCYGKIGGGRNGNAQLWRFDDAKFEELGLK